MRSVATDGKKVIGVDTEKGFIHCDQFVNCGGQVYIVSFICLSIS